MLRLSEAIRLGSMLAPQIQRAMFRTDISSHNIIGACALGAARMALGGAYVQPFAPSQINIPGWGYIMSFAAYTPRNPNVQKRRLDEIIVSLNDSYCWTREAIADWVEQIEKENGWGREEEEEECVSKSSESQADLATVTG